MITSLFDQLLHGETALSVIGLGYVGMPLSVSFARHFKVIGFDVDRKKIDIYKSGQDPTHELGGAAVQESGVQFTSDPALLKKARFHIIAVPTPIRKDYTPDLSFLEQASQLLGKYLTPGSVVMYESTVYPGVTEEVCVPVLEGSSGLRCGTDFKVGYSPERINPGDCAHRLESIVKVVSGMDEETLDCASKVYGQVVQAGIYRAETIRIAEAAKVIENSQRDINIAFMNELSVMFHRMGLDTSAVLRAAETKWNFLPFRPGLVGGHCIGVDPYYLTYKSEQVGYHSQVILAGRRINDSMGKYVAESCVKGLISADKTVKGAKVVILGITFKEDCPDVRNTKVWDIIDELNEYGISPTVVDPVADVEQASHLFGVVLTDSSAVKGADAVIVAVAHQQFSEMSFEKIDSLFSNEGTKILFDVKGIMDRKKFEKAGYMYWSL